MAYPGKPKYQRLKNMHDDNEKDDEAPFLPSNIIRNPRGMLASRLQLLLQAGTFFLTATVLILYIISFSSPHSSTSTSNSNNNDVGLAVGMNRVNPTAHRLSPCGQDAGTAKQNGCIFDLLTMAWLHRECYDAELSAEFLEAASEPFFYDTDGTKPIKDYVELSEVTETVFTTRRYHIFHCVYGWRLIHRALLRGGMIESGLAGYHHTEHCTTQLMNQTIPLEKVITRIQIDFPDC